MRKASLLLPSLLLMLLPSLLLMLLPSLCIRIEHTNAAML
jgi:hypothetical protein